ncbi:hypothetical protein RRF57_005517 [Xylaria bambusicola]|uniref:Uncharacterized protein n=1 Tax=Xylaria bambusicola TaxID=326684 RepID=A0AAN7UJZ9_9PEZI
MYAPPEHLVGGVKRVIQIVMLIYGLSGERQMSDSCGCDLAARDDVVVTHCPLTRLLAPS